MKKSDLKTGWKVTYRNGKTRIILFQTDKDDYKESDGILVADNGKWNDLNNYREDLTCKHASDYDIVSLAKKNSPTDLFDETIEFYTFWERDAPKEMTVEEIQEALGYKVKIVESK